MSVTMPERTAGAAAAPTLVVRAAGCLALCAATAALALPAVARLVEYSGATDSASHVVLIPFVTAALVWMGRAEMLAVVATSYPGLGLLAGGAGLALASMAGLLPGGDAAALFWSTGGLIVSWVGAFLFAFGPAAVRAARFPLLFLIFTMPIPDALLAQAVYVLKAGSADAVAAVFALTGTPYVRSAFIFELPGFVIEIADECSGIRSSIALTLTSLLAGHLFLASPSRKTLLVLAVLPVAIVKNAIRIATLTLLAVNVDPSFLVGQLHHDGGVVFFLLALALLVPVLSLLRLSETRWARLFRSTPSTR